MDHVIRGGNWYFGDLNTWRVLDEVKPPALKFNLEAFSAGGHHMGVEWPEDLEPFTAENKLAKLSSARALDASSNVVARAADRTGLDLLP